MTVTPANMPKRRPVLAQRPVYSTSTGNAPSQVGYGADFMRDMDEDEAHCFVCERHTNHFGEHDDMVGAGLAEYNVVSGSVYRISGSL